MSIDISKLGDEERRRIEDMDLPERCARYHECSAPRCPLDPFISIRNSDDTRSDPVCGIAAPTRHRYWQAMTPGERELLPFEGYLETEFKRRAAGRAKWEALSPEERLNRLRYLSTLRPGVRAARPDAAKSGKDTAQQPSAAAAGINRGKVPNSGPDSGLSESTAYENSLKDAKMVQP
jgi:hypothetical protein